MATRYSHWILLSMVVLFLLNSICTMFREHGGHDCADNLKYPIAPRGITSDEEELANPENLEVSKNVAFIKLFKGMVKQQIWRFLKRYCEISAEAFSQSFQSACRIVHKRHRGGNHNKRFVEGDVERDNMAVIEG